MKKDQIIKRLKKELDDDQEYYNNILYGVGNQVMGVEIHIADDEEKQ